MGRIDLLGKGADGAIVVIQIKEGPAGALVVGKIQNYILWVENNLAHGAPVRGIIVAQRIGSGLDEAMEASRFRISVVTFGEFPPTPDNTS